MGFREWLFQQLCGDEDLEFDGEMDMSDFTRENVTSSNDNITDDVIDTLHEEYLKECERTGAEVLENFED